MFRSLSLRFFPPVRSLLLLVAIVLLSGSAAAQTVRYVDADATGAGGGSSWADAFSNLQDALAVAESGDEVWVAEGIYRPTDGGDRDASFVLVNGVGFYGGFDGTEALRDERDPEENVTVLSGDLGVLDDVSDNAFHVVVASGVDGSTVLDGFTVTGGYGNGATPRNRGGGIYAEGASLVVRGCRIVGNGVVQTDGFGGGGGAFFGTSGTPRFERVVFERNGVNALGGGLWLRRSFEADTSGAAPLSAVLREVSFAGNTASFGGGAHVERASVVLVGAVFERNEVEFAGGGLRLSMSEGRFVNVGFYGNTGDPGEFASGGGGLWASGSRLALTNVAFVGNVARLSGAISLGSGSEGEMTNVTLAANEADENEGGGLSITSGSVAEVRNSALWGSAGGEVVASSGDVALRHVLLAGGCPPDGSGGAECEALLDADPLFVRAPDPGPDGTWGTPDDDYGDLRLQEGSPAIDFGLTAFLPPDTFDLDSDGDTEEPLPLDLAGEARVQGAAVDLGAYEYPGPVAAEPGPSTAAAVRLDAYPNPARGPVAVTLHLDRAQRAEIALFDVRGRRVAVLHDGPLAAGRHALRLAMAALPSGVYLLRLSGDASSITRRVVVLR